MFSPAHSLIMSHSHSGIPKSAETLHARNGLLVKSAYARNGLLVKSAYARNGLLVKSAYARNGLLVKSAYARTILARPRDLMDNATLGRYSIYTGANSQHRPVREISDPDN